MITVLASAYPLHVDWIDTWYWEVLAAIAKFLNGLKQDGEDVIFFWCWQEKSICAFKVLGRPSFDAFGLSRG